MKGHAYEQKAFLTMAFRAPQGYSDKAMRAGHEYLIEQGLTDVHIEAVARRDVLGR